MVNYYSMILQWAKLNWGITNGSFCWDDDSFSASWRTPVQRLAEGPCLEATHQYCRQCHKSLNRRYLGILMWGTMMNFCNTKCLQTYHRAQFRCTHCGTQITGRHIELLTPAAMPLIFCNRDCYNEYANSLWKADTPQAQEAT